MTLLDPLALALLLVANGAPLLAGLALRRRLAMPVDCGRRLADGRELFGPHKTWRGIAVAVLATAAAAALAGIGFAWGAATGLLAMLGDLASSFAKRRRGRPPGSESLLLDPLPEALLPLAALAVPLELGVAAFCGTALAFALLDVLLSRALR
ncbi:MAG: CDP-archaeol synthase [Steroidobacteraceae bacterium]|jgi:CDP-2,3-bis-(O-geranylgeranyl)-sn-glycerol synthase|nr:CDP-archaeol synthase [Steroidobacteraceae bacterium]